ncbi:MAG TPA: translocation/assembly module TamB domain-containing protein [Acidobacteriota bacterium]|nr:translocation/assembly module TamB domain-containing protein [Acidobacteriota bacterium]
MLARPLKYTAIALAVIILGLAGAVILLTSPPGERLAGQWLERQITSRTGAPVSIGQFETNLWSRAQLFRLALLTDSTSGADTLLLVDHVRIGFSLFDLIGSETRLRALAIDGVDLRLTLDSLGRVGLPAVDSPDRPAAPSGEDSAAIRIDTVSLTRVNAGYADARMMLNLHLHGAAAGIQAGEPQAYFGRVDIDSICAEYDDLPICVTGLKIAGHIRGDSITITRADAQIAGLECLASGSVFGPDWSELAFTMSLHGNPQGLAEIAGRSFELPDTDARELSVEVDVAGSISSPVVTARTSVHDARIRGILLDSLSLDCRYASDTLAVDSLLLSALGGIVTGTGRVILDSGLATNATLNVENLQVADVWQTVYDEPSPCTGVIAGELSVAGGGGKVAGWKAGADISASSMRYQQRAIPDMTMSLSLADEVAGLRIRHSNDTITATVRFDEDALDGEFRVGIPDIQKLTRFFDQPELAGRLEATGRIRGSTQNPVVDASLAGSGLRYRDFPADTLYGHLQYHDRALVIDHLVLHGELDASDTTRTMFATDSLGGGLRYRAQLAGSLDSLSGELSAELTAPRYGSYAADSAALQAALAGARIELVRFDLFRGGLEFSAHAAYDTSTARGHLEANLWTLESSLYDEDSAAADTILTRLPRGEFSSTIALTAGSTFSCEARGRDIWLGLIGVLAGDTTVRDGTFDLDLAVNGTLNDPAARFSVTARSIELSDVLIDSLLARAGFENNLFTLDSLTLYAVGQNVTAHASALLTRDPDGSPEFSEQSEVSGALYMDNLDLAAVRPFMVPDGALSGTASARLSWNGTVSAPHFDGWLRIRNAQLQLPDQAAAIEQGYADVSLIDTLLRIDSAGALVATLPLTMHGTVSTSEWEKFSADLNVVLPDVGTFSATGELSDDLVDLRIQAEDLDLSMLQPFARDLDSLGGTLTTDVHVRGEPSDPEIQGSLALSDVQLFSSKYYSALTHGYLAAAFDKRRINIDSAVAVLNEGTVQLAGSVTHDLGEITDINVNLHAAGVSFRAPELFLLNVDDARLNYAQVDDYYVLDGDIQLGEARLTARFRPQTILPWARSVETVEWELPEIVARTRLDVRIRESDDLWVDNNLARMRMHAELGVIGTVARPNLSGMINVEEGYLLYLDRRFRFNQGRVFFSDPNRFNPDILLDAGAQVSTYQRMAATKYDVYIRAEGLLDQLQVSLYSEPPLDKPDIVALLTLGATRTQLAGKGENGSEGGVRNVLVDRVSMLTSQRASAYVSSKVGSMFGFDEFTVEGNLFRFDKSWGPHLVASRRLGERVELTYSTTVGHLNDQNVRLGYRLTPRLSLQGETDRAGRSGIDLKYGFKFR